MPWGQWICALATSLEMDELDRYERYVIGGGDPKKFPWHYHSSSGESLSGSNVADQIISGWAGSGKVPMKGTMEEAANRGFVRKAGMTADGKYVDESGNVLDAPPPGYFFVKAPKATTQ